MSAITGALLKAAIGQIADVSALLRDGISNIPDDEAVAADALSDFALADPELAPQIAIVLALAPVAEDVIAWLIANNQSAKPGAQLPSEYGGSGARGSDPWIK